MKMENENIPVGKFLLSKLISIFYALFFGGKKEEIHFSPDGFM
jgi:hypothetical protein